ncbi:TerB family tellurite resistance protein [Hellea sp.]|nr:TerB family tellurite resistance protein [Hellea sp.]
MMTTQQHNILSLIAASIFADKRIFASEVEVFITSTQQLNRLKDMKSKLTEAELLQWYETHKEDIRQNISTPYFKDWFYDLLEKLSELRDKEALLDIMYKISIADGNVHVSERALITLAKRYWV